MSTASTNDVYATTMASPSSRISLRIVDFEVEAIEWDEDKNQRGLALGRLDFRRAATAIARAPFQR